MRRWYPMLQPKHGVLEFWSTGTVGEDDNGNVFIVETFATLERHRDGSWHWTAYRGYSVVQGVEPNRMYAQTAAEKALEVSDAHFRP